MTLIECLVASLVLALAASSVLVAMASALQQQRYAEELRVANTLAQQLLEQVSARTFVSPSDPDFAALAADSAMAMDGYSDTVDSMGDTATDTTSYLRILNVSVAADAGMVQINGAGLATVTVTTPSGGTVLLQRILPGR